MEEEELLTVQPVMENFYRFTGFRCWSRVCSSGRSDVLTKYASKVTVIAREPDFTCAKSIGDKVKAHPKIEVKFHTELVEATGDTQLRHAKFKIMKQEKLQNIMRRTEILSEYSYSWVMPRKHNFSRE